MSTSADTDTPFIEPSEFHIFDPRVV